MAMIRIFIILAIIILNFFVQKSFCTADWASYLKNLEAGIKENWYPPESEKSYSVVLLFKIGKNGELLSYKVQKGANKKANEAAIKALKNTAPFEYLPEEPEKGFVPVEFTFDYNVKDLPKEQELISKATNILKTLPQDTYYKAIKGDNPSKKPIEISFKELEKIKKKYQDSYMIGDYDKKKKVFYVFISEEYKKDSPEALSPLIASASIRINGFNSKNEETYILLVEAYVWKYLNKTKKFRKNDTYLEKRWNRITKLVEKSPQDGKYLFDDTNTHPGYNKFPQESKGFSNEEFDKKFKKLLKMYNEL